MNEEMPGIHEETLTMSDESDAGQEQRYLGRKGMIALIALLSAFVPLSTDIYLPALPGMARYFDVSPNLTNLTLILFFVVFSAGTLFWGPMSDKHGRRPVLLAGLTIYVLASVSCACAWDIYSLIIARIFQAVGGSGALAVATAMIKDVYSGRDREAILAAVQSMVLISPVMAPVLGAVILEFTSWRGVFWALAVVGILSLAGSIALDETIARRYSGTTFQVVCRLGTVLRNPGFTSLLAVFSLLSTASMAFVASSSYIYINGFGLSEQTYSYYFALNALGMISGPVLYMRISRRFERKTIIAAGFALISASGILVSSFGSTGPLVFAVLLLPATLSSSCLRPPGANLMLEQQQEDTGSASSLMSCFGILLGSLGMAIISLDWGNTILALGIMNIAVGLSGGLLWLLISQKPFVKQIPEGLHQGPQPNEMSMSKI
jgi:DHA1 family bicyclomycin/chloramphenicol resistance-like MFS transporter